MDLEHGAWLIPSFTKPSEFFHYPPPDYLIHFDSNKNDHVIKSP